MSSKVFKAAHRGYRAVLDKCVTKARVPSLLRHQSDGYIPPQLNRLDVSLQAPIIQGFLPDGFSIRGNILYGSVALLPRGFFSWKVVEESMVC